MSGAISSIVKAPPKPIGNQHDLIDMLLAAGIGYFNAPMSIEYMNFLPSTTDPYCQGVIQLVQGLQCLLNQRGANLEVDGGLGAETVQALMRYSGPRWFDRSWAQIYGDVMTGNVWRGWQREDRSMSHTSRTYTLIPTRQSQDGMGDFMSAVTSPLGVAAIALGLGMYFWPHKGRR